MFNKKAGLFVLLSTVTASSLFAGNFASYSIGDVLLCFRKSGVANDLVVDVGPISTFTNLAPNQRVTITQYAGNQLALVGTNGISWSAFTWYDNTVTPTSVQWTLFASSPRPALNTQSEPPPQATQSSQHLVGNQMVPVARGGYDQAVAYTNNALSTYTAAIEPDNNSDTHYVTGQSYSFSIGSDLNFNDTFGGFPENTTPSNFTLAGKVQRSDFYWIPPKTSGLSEVYLGYFELNTNGVMSYVAYPVAAPTAAVIQSISWAGNTASIKFTTGSTGTYTLRGTNNLTAPLTNWPAITSVAGNGSVNTLQDTDSSSSKFYIISTQ